MNPNIIVGLAILGMLLFIGVGFLFLFLDDEPRKLVYWQPKPGFKYPHEEGAEDE